MGARSSELMTLVLSGSSAPIQKVAEELLQYLDGEHLVVVAVALSQVSPSSYTQAVEALCQEMRRNRHINRLETINALAVVARDSDQCVIHELSAYLLHAKRVMEKDGTPPVMAALQALKRIAEPNQIEQARIGVLTALATKAAATGGKEYIQKLLTLAKEQGAASQAVLAALASGFRNHNGSIREACKAVFGKLCQRGDETAIGVLLGTIRDDVYAWSRCAAIDMLPKVIDDPRAEVAEVTACLLELCREADVGIKSAALCALRPCILTHLCVCLCSKRYASAATWQLIFAKGLAMPHNATCFK